MHLVEATQDIVIPVLRKPVYLWWGTTFHMQTPLENLEKGTFILVEFCNSNSLSDTPECIAWCRYDLDRETIDSIDAKLSLTTDPKPSNLLDISGSSVGGTGGGGAGSTRRGSTMPVKSGPVAARVDTGPSTLDCEMILSRRVKTYDLESMRRADNSNFRLLSLVSGVAADRNLQNRPMSVKGIDFAK